MKKLLLLILVLTGSQLFAQRQVWENFSYYGIDHPLIGLNRKVPSYYDRKGNEFWIGGESLTKVSGRDTTEYFISPMYNYNRIPFAMDSKDEVALIALGQDIHFVYYDGNEVFVYKDTDIYEGMYSREGFNSVVQTDRYVWMSQETRLIRYDKISKTFTFYSEAFYNEHMILSPYLYSEHSELVVAVNRNGKVYLFNEMMESWELLIGSDSIKIGNDGSYNEQTYLYISNNIHLVGQNGVYEYDYNGLEFTTIPDFQKLGRYRQRKRLDNIMVLYFDNGFVIENNGGYEVVFHTDTEIRDLNKFEVTKLDNEIVIISFYSQASSKVYYYSYWDSVVKYEGSYNFYQTTQQAFYYKDLSGKSFFCSGESDYDNSRFLSIRMGHEDDPFTFYFPNEFENFQDLVVDRDYVWVLNSKSHSSSDYSVWRMRIRNNIFIAGQLYYDFNKNGLKEHDEPGFDALPLVINPSGIMVFPESSGKFIFAGSIGEEYTMKILDDTLLDYVSAFLPYKLIEVGTNSIGVTLKNPKPQIRSNFYLPWPRCNTVSSTRLRIENTGYITADRVEISLISDGRSAIYSEEAAFVNGDTLFFELTDLNAKKSQDLSYFIEWPNAMMMGETLTFKAEIKTYRNQQLVSVEQDSISTMLRCSYDPNDKSVMPAGVGVEKYTLKDADLQYLIRFENTGNDTAYHVTIYDTLDSNLNKSTFKILGSSHEVQAEIHPSGVAVFYFENIMLPDTNTNMEAAQGFVRFSISPAFGLDERTVISNTAGIVFDSNPAIITNTVHSTMVTEIPDIVKDIRKKGYWENLYYPNPASEHVYMRGMNTAHTEVYNSHGLLIIKTPEREVSVRDWPAGIYLFQSVDEKGVKTGSIRIMVY